MVNRGNRPGTLNYSHEMGIKSAVTVARTNRSQLLLDFSHASLEVIYFFLFLLQSARNSLSLTSC